MNTTEEPGFHAAYWQVRFRVERPLYPDNPAGIFVQSVQIDGGEPFYECFKGKVPTGQNVTGLGWDDGYRWDLPSTSSGKHEVIGEVRFFEWGGSLAGNNCPPDLDPEGVPLARGLCSSYDAPGWWSGGTGTAHNWTCEWDGIAGWSKGTTVPPTDDIATYTW